MRTEWAGRKDDRFIFSVIKNNRDSFTTEFVQWLPSNLHILSEFCKRAIAIRKAGRDKYSARTICEIIRFETILKQRGNSGFKIDNDVIPYLSRLCMLVYPKCAGLFETRLSKSAIVDETTRKQG